MFLKPINNCEIRKIIIFICLCQQQKISTFYMLSHIPLDNKDTILSTRTPCLHEAYMSREKLTRKISYLACWTFFSKIPKPQSPPTLFYFLNANMILSGKLHSGSHIAGSSQNACAQKILLNNLQVTCTRNIWNFNEFCFDSDPILNIFHNISTNILK